MKQSKGIRPYKSPEYILHEKAEIEKLVKRLFVTQGLFANEDDIGILSEEIIRKDFDLKELKRAFQTLYDKRIKNISLNLICEAVEALPKEEEEEELLKCDFCNQDKRGIASGQVLAAFKAAGDKFPEYVSLACICEAGKQYSKHFMQWNGKDKIFQGQKGYRKGTYKILSRVEETK